MKQAFHLGPNAVLERKTSHTRTIAMKLNQRRRVHLECMLHGLDGKLSVNTLEQVRYRRELDDFDEWDPPLCDGTTLCQCVLSHPKRLWLNECQINVLL